MSAMISQARGGMAAPRTTIRCRGATNWIFPTIGNATIKVQVGFGLIRYLRTIIPAGGMLFERSDL